MISTSSAGVSTPILASNWSLLTTFVVSMLCEWTHVAIWYVAEVDNVQNVMGARVTRMPTSGCLSTVIERWGVSTLLYVDC
ncbi:hypothetical protein FB451DRAFT_1300927 [Mycena latifolia]|nr:hypothetical protein FB451DRAFT_1300927 [Mycena latifolia]